MFGSSLLLLLSTLVIILSLTIEVVAFKSTFTTSLRTSSHSNNHFATSRNSKTTLCMKTIAVFGASGLTGAECVYQALKNGDNVVGLTR
jgi:hypothetical protein